MALVGRGFCEGDNSVDGRDCGRAGHIGSLRTPPAMARGGSPLHHHRARACGVSRSGIRGGAGRVHRGLLEEARPGSAHAGERVPGRALSPQGAPEPSPGLYERALEKNGQLAAPRLFLGRVLLDERKPRKAVLAPLADSRPEDAEIRRTLDDAYYQSGSPALANFALRESALDRGAGCGGSERARRLPCGRGGTRLERSSISSSRSGGRPTESFSKG